MSVEIPLSPGSPLLEVYSTEKSPMFARTFLSRSLQPALLVTAKDGKDLKIYQKTHRDLFGPNTTQTTEHSAFEKVDTYTHCHKTVSQAYDDTVKRQGESSVLCLSNVLSPKDLCAYVDKSLQK